MKQHIVNEVYGMFSYDPLYDESKVGKSYICEVKDIPLDLKIIRAGILLYNEIKELKEPKEVNEIKQSNILNKVNEIKQQNIIKKTNERSERSEQYDKNIQKEQHKYQNIKNTHLKENLYPFGKISNEIESIINPRPELLDVCIADDFQQPKPKIIQTYEIIERKFCFGVDFQYGTLTDFGGKIKNGETIADAALREFEEESLNILKLTKVDISHCICVYNNQLLIIFAKVDININELNYKFNLTVEQEYNLNKRIEISKLKWMNEEMLLKELNVPYVIFEPVRSLLNNKIGEVLECLP
jgi:hypothetical protein